MRGRWYSNDYDDKSSKLASPSEKRALNEDVLGKNVDSPCESEDEADELTKSLDQLCRGFPQIDISQWSIRFQLSTFINDLQNGLTLSNALNRLQTMKAMMESKLTAFTSMGPGNASVPAYLASKGHEPKAVGKADESNIPIFHELVIPRDKREEGASGVSSTEGGNLMDDNDELRGLMQWDEALVDQDLLRSRIRKIHLLKDVSAKTKSRMVQTLMMGKFASDPLGRNSTKEEVRENNSSGDVVNNDSVAAYSRDSSVPPVVTDKDIQPSHHHSGVLGCPHYMRNCKLQCFKCEKWFACRFCHDEAVHSHAFERNKTKWILCMLCNHVQRPNSSECESCGQELALYFCKKCVLYDNDEVKDIYHCDECGICRLGLGLGQDFFHCDSCQACLSIELQGNHRCIERSTMSNCPICGEYMFTSVKPVVYMSPCGHAIHQQCFSDHTRHSYKCPECQVTVLNLYFSCCRLRELQSSE